MDIITKEAVEIAIELLCSTVVLGLLTFSMIGDKVIPLLVGLL